MPDSDRVKFSKIGLKRSIAVALLFVIALTVAGGFVQLGYYKQAADQSTKHQAWSENEIRRNCPSFNGLTKDQCSYQADNASQENQRAEYDLYAQRTSALWASIMAFAALLGIGLSGVGVWLVKITFEETKIGNAIATQTAQSDRAWFTFDVMNCALNTMPPDESGTRPIIAVFVISWKNTGQSPAVKAGCYTNSRKTKETMENLRIMDIEPFSEDGNWGATAVAGPGVTFVTQTNALNPHDTKEFVDGELGMIIYSKIKYATIYDEDSIRSSEVVLFACVTGMMEDGKGNLIPQLHVMPIGQQNTAN